ncbi:MAG: DNA processing protein [Bermanella sp.]
MVIGLELATGFAATLAARGLCITSGLAYGVDAASHRGALSAKGKTIAVLGTGIDQIYPRRNTEPYREIAEHGILVSEFPLGSPPRREQFPQRNRLISGLSLGVLVLEAAVRSGSLITARFALEQGREVFAIPGSIRNP